MTTKQIDLSEFHGTFYYYKVNMFSDLNCTDGVQFLRGEGNCFWLTDVIASYQHKLKDQPFQVWKLKVNDKDEGVVTCEDGNGNQLKKQKIPYTDFKSQTGLDEVELWVSNKVVLLPQEY